MVSTRIAKINLASRNKKYEHSRLFPINETNFRRQAAVSALQSKSSYLWYIQKDL